MGDKKDFALSKKNFLLIGISFGLIILGFILMTGKPTVQAFNPDIFSFRRITVGPMISLAGFFLMAIAILWKPKKEENDLDK
jgi:uncharacterized membrane protein